MWECRHGVDGRDYCEKCYESPATLSGDAGRKLTEAAERLAPWAKRAEMRWMSVEDATIEMPARLVAEIGRALHPYRWR
jgi:hypothetical protein